MNRNGRLVGGVLVGIALLWLLRILGALPFSDRTTNQIGQNQASAQTPPDRPPIADFDATRTSIANFNPGTGTEDFNTPGSGTVAQDPGTGTTTGNGTGTGSGASTRPAPAVPGAW
ncbi:hypothetical protein [Leptolyngbya sp. NIES-2104]|uniref:hypothetical protein n=1 Tax=Leptolyngbya sp. NIES-2104 TaxID=1552121 RepID=UPI0006EC5FCC|nr:hypothetical protein [Leptolyngbya sp. NIES-2104]GAP97477.1 hypothetical protein NIES2104_40240 [Leptolyngbya sp. NIES-2104]